jgi:hypothetical protein
LRIFVLAAAALVSSSLVVALPAPRLAAASTCVPDATTLCLNGRFAVRAQFDAGDGNAGAAHGVKLTPDTGYLWFFSASNVETIVKVLDGCGLNDRFWVFAGGLTDVNVVLTVTDTSTGSAKTYTNPPHTTFQPIQDTDAFEACAPPGDPPPEDTPPVARFHASCVLRACTVSPNSDDDVGIEHYLWDWGDGTPVLEATSPYPWAEQSHDYAESGRFTITHSVVDTAGQTGSMQVDVVPNTPPIAADDEATTMRDLAVTIDLLANDVDADGDALGFGSLSPQHPGAIYEVVSIPGGIALRVTPPDSYVGVMTFSYILFDDLGAQDSAEVTLTILQYGTSSPP